MILNFKSILVVLLATFVLAENPSNKRPKSRRKLVDALAVKFIGYFDLENKLIADFYFDSSNENYKCENIDRIGSYFMEVYSKNSDMNLTALDLEGLISFQIKNRYKDSETKARSNRNKCARKKVFLILFLSYLWPL